ncbi:MAG: cupin domain-containing protein [Rhodospirillaceae bacterium]
MTIHSNNRLGTLPSLTLVLIFLGVAPTFSQSLPQHAVRVAAPLEPIDDTFIALESAETMVLAEWEVVNDLGARIRIVWGQEAVDAAPPEASRYVQRSYVFPTGTIRVLEFKEGQGGMLHAITVETALYMLEGEGKVEVAGKTIAIGQGDVVSYPSGTLRGEGDATVILWHVTGTKINGNAKATVVRAKDASFRQLGYWNGPDGSRIIATTSEDLQEAPPDAIRLDLNNYQFDGNRVSVTKNYKGGPTNKNRSDLDALIYITSGKMRFFQDDVDVIAEPGDAIREIAGRYHNWIRLEDSSFVATSTAPMAPLAQDTQND